MFSYRVRSEVHTSYGIYDMYDDGETITRADLIDVTRIVDSDYHVTHTRKLHAESSRPNNGSCLELQLNFYTLSTDKVSRRGTGL